MSAERRIENTFVYQSKSDDVCCPQSSSHQFLIKIKIKYYHKLVRHKLPDVK